MIAVTTPTSKQHNSQPGGRCWCYCAGAGFVVDCYVWMAAAAAAAEPVVIDVPATRVLSGEKKSDC